MGNKLNPIELLKFNDIDLEDPDIYEVGFATFKDLVNAWEELVNQSK